MKNTAEAATYRPPKVKGMGQGGKEMPLMENSIKPHEGGYCQDDPFDSKYRVTVGEEECQKASATG